MYLFFGSRILIIYVELVADIISRLTEILILFLTIYQQMQMIIKFALAYIYVLPNIAGEVTTKFVRLRTTYNYIQD